jgi:hypothetical protein
MPCWINLLRPVTDAEHAAWKFYLALHSTHWRPARHMFRRACQGEDPGANLLRFISDTGIIDPSVVAHLTGVLRDLAGEMAR